MGVIIADDFTVEPMPDEPEHAAPPDDDTTVAELDAAYLFARAVERQAYDMRVREAARRKVATERSGDVDRPHAVSLRDFLAAPDPDVTYRVDRLWPAGGRIVLAAQWKAGKSTVVGNLIRALADGTPFLDHFDTGPAGRIVLLDDELDQRTLRRWLRAHQVVNVDAVRLVSLRGRVATFDLLDPETRAEWAAELVGADVVILDCLRPVLDALGLDESREAGRFLVGFDALLRDARADIAGPEAAEGLIVHHHGHTGERSRGDSRILDWPDATWKLVRQDPDDPASPRYLSAYGRDVDVSEGRLTYDEPTRRLTFTGGNRRDSAAEAALPDVLDLLAGQLPGGLSQRQVETRMADSEHTRSHVRDALKAAVDRGEASRAPRSGRGGGFVYTASAPVRRSVPEVRQHTSEKCASAPIGRTAHTSPQIEPSSAPVGAVDDPCPGCVQPTADPAPSTCPCPDLHTEPGHLS